MVGSVRPEGATREVLAEMMVGRKVILQIDKVAAHPEQVVLAVSKLQVGDDRDHHAVNRVSVEGRAGGRVHACVAEEAKGKSVCGAHSLLEWVVLLSRRRRVMLMVKAGAAVDSVIEQLLPLLDRDDIVIDGGNSLFTDTERREAWLTPLGLCFIGAGVSGGEELSHIHISEPTQPY